MPTEEGTEPETELDEVMTDIKRELVRKVAASDRERNRDIYDALESE